MIGSQLLRFSTTPFLIFDTETEGLNLFYHRPWELSYAIATLKDGIQSIHTHLIRWPNMRISEEAARVTRFDRGRYEREAKDPREVWSEFSPLLYTSGYRSAGHNLLGFDIFMISTWRAAMGMEPDHSWAYNPPVIDTNCLAKAYLKQWTPDVSSPEAFLSWEYKAQSFIEKGLKTRLGVICGKLGIEYDEKQAHGALYDVDRNWLVLKELIWKMDI